MAAKKNPYSNIVFESYVDWQHVDPRLLQTINKIARSRGEMVDVFSGYRSDDYSKAHGGFSGDPHTQGVAVDAYVNGKPIGDAWGASIFKNAGLRTGSQPNFYHGKPDPSHVDLLVDGYTPTTTTEPPAPGSDPATATVSAGDLIQQDLASSEPAPTAPQVGPNVVGLPGTALLPPAQRPRYETWQTLAALPGASTDTMRLAQLASLQNDSNQN